MSPGTACPASPGTCTSAASPGPPPTRWLGFRLRNWKRNRDRDGNGSYVSKCRGRWVREIWGGHLLEEVTSVGCQVGRQHQLPLEDLVDGLLAVLGGERRLWGHGGAMRSQVGQGGSGSPRDALPVPREEGAAAGLADPVSMSYIRAPRLHQSTARLCPLRTRISGALGGAGGGPERMGGQDRLPQIPPSAASTSHVLDGAAEGVGDGSVMDGLLAQPEVRQLDVT